MGGPAEQASLCVLVVEDEVFVRMTTVDMLAELGHTVLEADSGGAALALLDANPSVALLLTDIGLPDMRGQALAAQCRARRPALPIIFATGYDSKSVLDEFGTAEGVYVLGKPFQERDLEKALEAAFASGA